MNRVKRWLLILAAVVIVLPNVQAVKATALIFGRTPASATSTTSTTESTSDDNEEVPSTDQLEDEVTKPPLTGIPQIDYIWDPNLPRELNGFNLSTYPFLSSVPDAEDIDFKCDGLHDGFYASIKFGCQLYHHCIYGIRHDFLCANFTAFDQKTFICHFVSEVNCKNSAKYWFRNDALYRAITTTTTTTTTIAPPTTERQRRPLARKPLRRRRPQNDYYYEDEEYEDDYVEERINRRRKQPARNRYRPVYEDDYPNERGYEEDEDPIDDDYDYEQRSTNQSRNRNRPLNNRRYRNRERNNRRNLNEARSSSRSQEDEPRSFVDSRQSEPNRRFNRDRRPIQEDRRPIQEDRRSIQEDRRPIQEDRRPIQEDRRSIQDDRERVRERDRNRYTTNNGNKRPLRNEEEEEQIEFERPRQNYDEADDELPRRNNFRNPQGDKRLKGRTTPSTNRDELDDPSPPSRRKNVREETREEERPKVRPSSSNSASSVFSRPRVPPKISRPVPINEKQKYDYKKSENPPVAQSDGKEYYYDEYEDEEIPAQKPQSKPELKPQEKQNSKPISATTNSRPSSNEDDSIDEEYDDAKASDKYDDVVENRDEKHIPKTEKETKASIMSEDLLPQSVPRINKNSNDNNERLPIPSGASIFQTEQQQKLRDKFRNSFRLNTQSRQPVEDIPKAQSDVIAEDRIRNDQKPSTEQQNIRGKFRNNYRSNVKELRPSSVQPPTAADEEIENLPNVSPKSVYIPYRPSSSRFPPTAKDNSPQIDVEPPLIGESARREPSQNKQQLPPSATDFMDEDVRPIVRVVKRPFLPSRGGNPYLPRGLRPVGSSEEETYNSASNKDQSNENNRQPEPIIPLHPRINMNYDQRSNFPGPLTTQPPQVEPPKDPLEHIYSEYDVTLNDALNPTLKPLVTSRGSPIGFSLNNKYEQQQYSYVPLNIAPAQSRSSSVQVPYADKKFKTHYVDDYEY